MRSPSEICLSCGRCCNDHNLAPFLFPQDAIFLASKGFGDILCIENNEDNEPEIRLHTRITGNCLFFDHHTKRCQIYDTRPTVCKIFPYGGDELSNGDPDSRKKWIVNNCSLFAEYGSKSPLRIEAMKLMAKAQQLEYQLASSTIRFVHDLIQNREKRLEQQWEFKRSSNYGLTYWGRENIPIEEIIEWTNRKAQETQKSRIGVMLTFYDRHYRALCTIQGVFQGKFKPNSQPPLPTCHKGLLKALDDYYDFNEDSDVMLLEGWEPWPPL